MEPLQLVATIVCSALASSGLWAFVQTLISKKSGKEKMLEDIKTELSELKKDNIESHKYRDAMISAQREMMRERLLEAYYRCTAKGYYSRAERETYGALFERYESEPFNGDGVLHDLQPIMKNLPWEKET